VITWFETSKGKNTFRDGDQSISSTISDFVKFLVPNHLAIIIIINFKMSRGNFLVEKYLTNHKNTSIFKHKKKTKKGGVSYACN